MAALEIDGNDLVVRLSHWERAGALRRHDVRVPLSSVAVVREVDDAYSETKGLRAPGTGFPNRILLGTWRRKGSKDFIAVYRHAPGVVIELNDQPFKRLVVSGPRPEGL